MTRPLPHPRGLLLTTGAVLAVLTLAACSGTGGSGTPASAAPSGAPARTGGGQLPGTSGTIAAVAGSSMEVQNPTDGQVTVTWTSATTFTDATTGSLADATVGSCVTASATPTRPPGVSPSAGGGSTTDATAFTATTVQVTAATNGACTTGRGGTGAYGTPSARPSGTRGGGFGGFGARASGTVTAVAGDVLTVAVPAEGSRAASTDTVTTTSSTTFTDVVTGSATDAVVGRCVVALGQADDTGSVAATRVAVSTPGPNGCTTGFGRRSTTAAPGTAGA